MRQTIRLGGGTNATPPYQELRIGRTDHLAGIGTIVSPTYLVINCESRDVYYEYNGARDDSAHWTVQVVNVDTVNGQTVETVAREWLSLPSGANTLYISEEAQGTFSVTVNYQEGYH